jgi:hypothetical protein
MHTSAIAILVPIMALTGLAMYFLPTIVAMARKHRQLPAIALLNIFLGWTVLFWILSLVWALTSPAQVVVIQQAAPPQA